MTITVCPLSKVQSLADTLKPSHVVSLLGPDMPHPRLASIPEGQHLKLTFHDIAAPRDGFTPAGEGDIERLLSFLQAWPRQRAMLIHCWAGISRSTAAAYVATCLFRPEADEEELAWDLRRASPSATPNRLIVSLADAALGREGRMIEAIAAIGRGAEAFEGTPFTLPVA